MIRHLRLTLLLVVLVIPFSVQAQRDPPVDQIELKSSLLGRTISYRILYPVQYQNPEKREKRFPALYLLHGVTGHNSDWLAKTRLALYATQYDLFVVMVEGENGWYVDSATVPADKYESYILKELIPDVEKRFRVSQERAGRAVAGLSMGGYGAIKFGLKYPELFGFVASMSGAFGGPLSTDKELKDFGVVRDSIFRAFGPADSPTRRANDVFKLTRELPTERIASLPFIYLDCGTEDFLFQNSRDLSGLFVERKIPHEYRQLPGTHDWQYWDKQIREILRLTTQRLDPPK